MGKEVKIPNASSFWVIFDTCQRPEYYQDVHNLIALPPGAVLRYDYHQNLLSDPAIGQAGNPDTAPAECLLVYAQFTYYVRGTGTGYKPLADDQIVYVPTRLARMRSIPKLSGDKYAFDLELAGYPFIDQSGLDEIMKELSNRNETPWHKWVSLSDNLVGLNALKRNSPDNWAHIVDVLGAPPSQFAGDFFWRLKRPVYGTGKKFLGLEYETHEDVESAEVRGISYVYAIEEGTTCRFAVESHTPQKSGGTARHDRRLRLALDANGPLELLTDSVIDLRQYTEATIGIGAKRSDYVDERRTNLRLTSGDSKDDWPIGARLSIPFAIRKSFFSTIVGSFSLVGGLLTSVFGIKAWDIQPGLGILIVFVGAMFVLAGSLILNGKISVKL